jgi:hypothetical protein
MKVHLDDGRDFVEGDLLRCSKKYPAQDPNADLTKFGAFYLDKPFIEFKQKEQEEMFDQAFAHVERKARELIQKADQVWAGDPKGREWIRQTPLCMEALRLVSELEGEEQRREWAPTRASGKKHKDCQFCGHRNTLASVVCANCKLVTDQAAYDKLQGKGGK